MIKEDREYSYGTIVTQVSYLEGKVLTVIDAAFSDERQLKAVKDLVKKQFREQLDWIYEIGIKTILKNSEVSVGIQNSPGGAADN